MSLKCLIFNRLLHTATSSSCEWFMKHTFLCQLVASTQAHNSWLGQDLVVASLEWFIHEWIELVNRHLNTNTRVSCYSSFNEFGWLAYSLGRAGFRDHENTFEGQKNLQPAICLALSRSDSQHLIWHITVIVDAKGEIIYHDRVTWFRITLTQFKSGVPGYTYHEWNKVNQKNLSGTICFGFNWQSGVWWLVIWCSCSCTHHIYLVWCGNRAIWGFRNSAHWIVHLSLWPWRVRILPSSLEGWWKDKVPSS